MTFLFLRLKRNNSGSRAHAGFQSHLPFQTRMVKERTTVFGIVRSLAKAAVGVVIELPVSVVADAVTLGGQLSDKGRSYTADAVNRVVENVEAATKKDGK